MQQPAALLSLLAGPTKAAVASALSAGASLGAASLVLSGRNPALCYVERVPYDDQAFKARRGQTPHPPPPPPAAAARPRIKRPPCLPASRPPAPRTRPPSHAQSVYGGPRERALASSKPQRPVGWMALARITTPSHVAFAFARK